jgi:hypothetical protein
MDDLRVQTDVARLHAPIVYYARRGDLIKIGTTTEFRRRMSRLDIDEILAVELGEFLLESARHAEFAEYLSHDEWFHPGERLITHTDALRAQYGVPALVRQTSRGQRIVTPEARAILALLPPLVRTVKPGTLERFARTVSIDEESGCWRRSGGVDPTGYGAFWFEGVTRSSHIASHLMFVGPIPAGWQVDHVRERGCVWRDCVLPAHLEAVLPLENLRRIPVERRMGTIRGAQQRAKTHCPQGHPYTEDNVYWRKAKGPRGKPTRQCKTCTKERRFAEYWEGREPAPPRVPKSKMAGPKRQPHALKTHCPQGHEYTPDNIYWTGPKKNRRNCKTCVRARARAQHETHRIGDGPVAVSYQTLKTHCPQGHPYAGENLYIGPRGDRICIECKRKNLRRHRQRKREAAAA